MSPKQTRSSIDQVFSTQVMTIAQDPVEEVQLRMICIQSRTASFSWAGHLSLYTHRSIFSAFFYLAIQSVGSKKIALNHGVDIGRYFSNKRSLSCTELRSTTGIRWAINGFSRLVVLQAKWFLCWDPQICRVTESLNVGGKPKKHL